MRIDETLDPMTRRKRLEEYEEYFNNLPDGAEALSFHEWLEAIS